MLNLKRECLVKSHSGLVVAQEPSSVVWSSSMSSQVALRIGDCTGVVKCLVKSRATINDGGRNAWYVTLRSRESSFLSKETHALGRAIRSLVIGRYCSNNGNLGIPNRRDHTLSVTPRSPLDFVGDASASSYASKCFRLAHACYSRLISSRSSHLNRLRRVQLNSTQLSSHFPSPSRPLQPPTQRPALASQAPRIAASLHLLPNILR